MKTDTTEHDAHRAAVQHIRWGVTLWCRATDRAGVDTWTQDVFAGTVKLATLVIRSRHGETERTGEVIPARLWREVGPQGEAVSCPTVDTRATREALVRIAERHFLAHPLHRLSWGAYRCRILEHVPMSRDGSMGTAYALCLNGISPTGEEPSSADYLLSRGSEQVHRYAGTGYTESGEGDDAHRTPYTDERGTVLAWLDMTTDPTAGPRPYAVSRANAARLGFDAAGPIADLEDDLTEWIADIRPQWSDERIRDQASVCALLWADEPAAWDPKPSDLTREDLLHIMTVRHGLTAHVGERDANGDRLPECETIRISIGFAEVYGSGEIYMTQTDDPDAPWIKFKAWEVAQRREDLGL